MEQVLTVTILSYFETIHQRTLTTSNAIELLSRLKEFETIHQSHKNQFQPFRGLNFDTIHDIIKQDIHRIHQSHKQYQSNGNLLTPTTKQRDIETANQLHKTTIDTKAIGEELYYNIMDVSNGKRENTKSTKPTTKDMITKTLLRDRLRNSKK